MADKKKMIFNIVSVSYTHLDVYKRQDEERVEVRVDGELVKVTPMEYKILLLLMKNPGRVFSADEIYERVWNERAVNTDTIMAVSYTHLDVYKRQVPLILGVVLIGMNMPNVKREGKVAIDVPGIIALVVALAGILLALNFGSSMGWGNPMIIAGFVIGIVALVVLVKIEGKSAEPLIPLKLFKNSQYTVLLIIGFICYFYQSAMLSLIHI